MGRGRVRGIAGDADAAFAVGWGGWVVEKGPDVGVFHEGNKGLDGGAPGFIVGEDFGVAGGDDPVFEGPGWAGAEGDDCGEC